MPPSTSSPTSLVGLNVLISGGTTGIGRATAIALAREGCNVFVFGRHEAELHETLRESQGLEGSVKGMTANQEDSGEIEKVFSTMAELFSSLDVLVNNAGISGNDLSESSDQDILSTVNTNLCGYMFCARRAVELMRRKSRGHIINVGSINAEEIEADGEIYTATKAAIRAFSEASRKTVQKKGIKVSLIEPGATGSDMSEVPPDEQKKEIRSRKMVRAEDVADAIIYCLSRPRQTVIASIQVLPLLDEES